MPRKKKIPKTSTSNDHETVPGSRSDSKTLEEEIPKRDFAVCFKNADGLSFFFFIF